jgi:phage gp37-like protein
VARSQVVGRVLIPASYVLLAGQRPDRTSTRELFSGITRNEASGTAAMCRSRRTRAWW